MQAPLKSKQNKTTNKQQTETNKPNEPKTTNITQQLGEGENLRTLTLLRMAVSRSVQKPRRK